MGTETEMSCSLECPEGIEFEFAPAPIYKCKFAEGKFTPTPFPKCLYGEGIKVIQSSPVETKPKPVTTSQASIPKPVTPSRESALKPVTPSGRKHKDFNLNKL
jgi:hypothetical protein